MNKTVLITGGTGLIGKVLTEQLLLKGYTVHHLSRRNKGIASVQTFYWDIQSKKIDPSCIKNVNTIVHLAGEGIAAKRWTRKQKKLILESRTESIRLLYNLLKNTPDHSVTSIISASGVGYYGNRANEELIEESIPGNDFLAKTCIEWEKAVDEAPNLDVTKLRTGVVLSPKGGALQQIEKPIQLGVGCSLGTGNQWMPWIHITDLVNLYIFVLENNLKGVYNAAANLPVTNRQLTNSIAKALNKPVWLPAVPALVMKLLLGEMSAVVLNSTKTSVEKIKHAGFKFTFETLYQALTHIYGR